MLQGEEILSQRSKESEDDDEEEAHRSPLQQEESGDEVPAFPGFLEGIMFTSDTGISDLLQFRNFIIYIRGGNKSHMCRSQATFKS